jgi:hypothetical protein
MSMNGREGLTALVFSLLARSAPDYTTTGFRGTRFLGLDQLPSEEADRSIFIDIVWDEESGMIWP